MIYVVEFDHDEDRYVAVGQEPLHLSVYEIVSTRLIQKTRMLYPSCLRFMPEAFVHTDEPRTMTWDQFGRLYDTEKRI